MATPLRPSHYLELVHPLWGTHHLQARVESVWDETSDARTLTLRPGRGFRAHRAGQHVRVGVVIGGRRMTRTYSISSSPDRADGCFTITVKTFEDARVSRYLVREAAPGTLLSIGQPQGDFRLPDATPVRPLFITAGSGITPIMSMLRTFALRRAMPDAVHIHYAPHARDVIFGAELERLAKAEPQYRLHTIFTRDAPRTTSAVAEPTRDVTGTTSAVAESARSVAEPTSAVAEPTRGVAETTRDATRRARHFSEHQLEHLCPDWHTRDVWACGPQSLLDALGAHFARAGRAAHFHVERFTAKLAELPADAAGGTVRFCKSGVEARADGKKALLRVAEDAGIAAPHGCRMGVCHTCDATLIAGSVRDLRSGLELDEPGTRVQLCVAAAAGNVEIEL
ncbi:ferredoxin reductase [Pendulispora albinea]|uniref:Ferredoxin reductase n=1 Tax=Pendulispora albinea TaxID=2741071 RepID=A0ABZ2LRM9_9BACT